MNIGAGAQIEAGLFQSMEKALPRLKIEIPPLDQIQFPGFNLGPWQLFILFMAASFIMIWRLNIIEQKGFEGTIIGTLVMPFCSGFANLAFAFIMADIPEGGTLVLENCIVNNVTNLTLMIGIPAMIWGLNISQSSKGKKKSQESSISYLSLLLSLVAMVFFTLAVWLLSRDGVLDASDGMVLTGIFILMAGISCG